MMGDAMSNPGSDNEPTPTGSPEPVPPRPASAESSAESSAVVIDVIDDQQTNNSLQPNSENIIISQQNGEISSDSANSNESSQVNAVIPPQIPFHSTNSTKNNPTHVEDMTKSPTLKDCVNCKFKAAYHLKCKHCPRTLCFHCTLLPRENFLYYFLTNSQYRCTECCVTDLIKRNKDLNEHYIKLDEEFELIKKCDENRRGIAALKNHNLDTAVPTNCNAQNRSLSDNNDRNQPNSQEKNAQSILGRGSSPPFPTLSPPSFPSIPTFPPPPTETPEKRKCKFFLNGYCKKSREDCDFDHPKLCSKFMRGRENLKFGCRKGKERCKFFHPQVCFELEDYGYCQRNDHGKCRYFHRKNAVRTDSAFELAWGHNFRQTENRRLVHEHPHTPFCPAPPPPNLHNNSYTEEFPELNGSRRPRRNGPQAPPPPPRPGYPHTSPPHIHTPHTTPPQPLLHTPPHTNPPQPLLPRPIDHQPATDFLNQLKIPRYVLSDFIAEEKMRQATSAANR